MQRSIQAQVRLCELDFLLFYETDPDRRYMLGQEIRNLILESRAEHAVADALRLSRQK